MADTDEKNGQRPSWSHDVKAGLEPLRDAVQKVRDQTAQSLAELQKELEKKKALAARFGRR